MLCEWCCQSRMWLGRHRNFFCPRIIICRIESFNFGSSSSDSRSGCLVITKEHYWNCLQIGRERLILLIKENGSWHGDYSPTSSRCHETDSLAPHVWSHTLLSFIYSSLDCPFNNDANFFMFLDLMYQFFFMAIIYAVENSLQKPWSFTSYIIYSYLGQGNMRCAQSTNSSNKNLWERIYLYLHFV